VSLVARGLGRGGSGALVAFGLCLLTPQVVYVEPLWEMPTITAGLSPTAEVHGASATTVANGTVRLAVIHGEPVTTLANGVGAVSVVDGLVVVTVAGSS